MVSALRRLAIGPFSAAGAVALDELSLESIQQRLQPPSAALQELPCVEISHQEQMLLEYGQLIGNRWQVAGAEIAALSASGRLIAILGPAGIAQLRPTKGFPAGAERSG